MSFDVFALKELRKQRWRAEREQLGHTKTETLEGVIEFKGPASYLVTFSGNTLVSWMAINGAPASGDTLPFGLEVSVW